MRRANNNNQTCICFCFDKNSLLLFGSARNVTNHLQRILNCAAEIILYITKSYNLTAYLKSLYWLPAKAKSTYTIACLCYHCHSSTAPSYVTDMLQKKSSHTRNTRSSSNTMLLLNSRSISENMVIAHFLSYILLYIYIYIYIIYTIYTIYILYYYYYYTIYTIYYIYYIIYIHYIYTYISVFRILFYSLLTVYLHVI